MDYGGRQIAITAQTSTLWEEVLDVVARRFGICRKGLKATPDDPMNPYLNLADNDLENGDTICIYAEQIGGKPVIYLHSPNEIVASLKLSLVPEWEFSVIYPKVPIKEQQGQHIEWTVRTQRDGSLVETSTGTEVAYLFWEAKLITFSNNVPKPSLTMHRQNRFHSAHDPSSISRIGSVIISRVLQPCAQRPA